MSDKRRQQLMKMKKVWVAVALLITVAVAALSVTIWTRHLEELSALKHDTDRWAVIQDVNGDRMAVEPTSGEVWSQLVQLSQNGSRRWVGGMVERYDNKWGFRFNPETVTVAEVTIEEAQATIKYISEHVDERLDKWTYVSSRVAEVHS